MKKLVNKFLFKSNNIQRDTYVWNTICNMLLAFQSVIILMVLTRVIGLKDAGIFTIANANANLFIIVGKYGMRNYQVSDTKNKYTFGSFLVSRVFTSVLMIIISVVYVLIAAAHNNYTKDKVAVIIIMCVIKVPDAIEDVFWGEYQKRGRLDVASKAMTYRLAIFIITVIAGILITNDLIESLIISFAITVAVMSVNLICTIGLFKDNLSSQTPDTKDSIRILVECFPLFAGTFLNYYITNAPKYAIDSVMNDEVQACFGFIAMPVFVTSLVSTFLYNPILYKLSCDWNEGHPKAFMKKSMKQVVYIIGITLVSIIGAYILGIPVLSLIYGVDLTDYKSELLIMLAGGGFLALSTWINIVVTIMRRQKYLLIGNVITSGIALIFSEWVVEKYGVMGATVLYTMLMLVLTLCYVVVFLLGYLKSVQKEGIFNSNI